MGSLVESKWKESGREISKKWMVTGKWVSGYMDTHHHFRYKAPLWERLVASWSACLYTPELVGSLSASCIRSGSGFSTSKWACVQMKRWKSSSAPLSCGTSTRMIYDYGTRPPDPTLPHSGRKAPGWRRTVLYVLVMKTISLSTQKSLPIQQSSNVLATFLDTSSSQADNDNTVFPLLLIYQYVQYDSILKHNTKA